MSGAGLTRANTAGCGDRERPDACCSLKQVIPRSCARQMRQESVYLPILNWNSAIALPILVAIPAKTVSPKAIHKLPIPLTCPPSTH